MVKAAVGCHEAYDMSLFSFVGVGGVIFGVLLNGKRPYQAALVCTTT